MRWPDPGRGRRRVARTSGFSVWVAAFSPIRAGTAEKLPPGNRPRGAPSRYASPMQEQDRVAPDAAAREAMAGHRIVIVMPAYNAARTLERTYADIPHDLIERIVLVDDVSRDETVEIAKQLGLDVIVHRQNRGYGGQPEDLLRRGAGDGRRGRDHAAPRLPVRRDADPRARGADPPRGRGPHARQPLPRRSPRRRHADLEVHLEPLPDGARELRVRAAALGVPHRLPRLLAAPARDDPVSPQLRRLRVRPGAGLPGRRGGGFPDRRDRGPDALLRGGKLRRLPEERRVRAVDAAGRRPVRPPPGPRPALAQADAARAARLNLRGGRGRPCAGR